MPAAINSEKTPTEVFDYQFDFRRTEFLSDDPLASGTVTEVGSSDLTIGSVTVSGTRIQARISGGVDAEQYVVRVVGTTEGGQVVQGDVLLDVDEPE